jgi:hypothetical protein
MGWLKNRYKYPDCDFTLVNLLFRSIGRLKLKYISPKGRLMVAGITNLAELLRSMNPKLVENEFVFCTVSGALAEYLELDPIATFREPEGLTLVVEKSMAEQFGLAFEATYSQIILTVHSSLDAVGLTAAVAEKLTSVGISANVIAAYYHDHIFVQTAKAQQAIMALKELTA